MTITRINPPVNGQAITPSSVAATGDVTAVKNGKTYSLGTLGESVSPPKGTFNLSGFICSGYITGSGNYLTVGIPISPANFTTAAISSPGTITVIKPDGSRLSTGNIDTSYGNIAARGSASFAFEMKFASTQTPNVPATVYFSGTTLALS